MVLFGSHMRVRWLRWMANHVDERVPVAHLRRVYRTGSATYLRLMRTLHDHGLVSHDPGFHWVVEPHPAWEQLKELLGAET